MKAYVKCTRYVPKNGFKNPRSHLAIKSQGNIIRGFVKHVPQIKTIFESNFETIISVSY